MHFLKTLSRHIVFPQSSLLSLRISIVGTKCLSLPWLIRGRTWFWRWLWPMKMLTMPTKQRLWGNSQTPCRTPEFGPYLWVYSEIFIVRQHIFGCKWEISSLISLYIFMLLHNVMNFKGRMMISAVDQILFPYPLCCVSAFVVNAVRRHDVMGKQCT